MPQVDSISFACPKCGTVLKVPMKYAGVEGTCRNCKALVLAPSAVDQTPQLETPRSESPQVEKEIPTIRKKGGGWLADRKVKKLYPSKEVPKRITSIWEEVAGTAFDNDNGTSRRTYIRLCDKGDYLRLIRDPKNKHDKNAVKVCVDGKYQIGFLEAFTAEEIAPRLDSGERIDAEVAVINQGHSQSWVKILLVRYVDEYPLLEWHTEQNKKIREAYKRRKDDAKAMEETIEACEELIRHSPRIKEIYEERGKELPSHLGYKNLAMICESAGSYSEVLELCSEALLLGWKGDWEKRYDRCIKKMKES